VDHPKTGQIGPVLGWLILGYPVLVNMDHPKSRFVRFSDPHCIRYPVQLSDHKNKMASILFFYSISELKSVRIEAFSGYWTLTVCNVGWKTKTNNIFACFEEKLIPFKTLLCGYEKVVFTYQILLVCNTKRAKLYSWLFKKSKHNF
jgi:hypothetical protein